MLKKRKNMDLKENITIGFLLLVAILIVGGVLGRNIGIEVIVNAATQTERETNDSYATANTITLGNSVTGNISNYDEDYYKIISTSNGKIELDFCHTYMDSYGIWMVSTYKYENGEYIKLSSINIDLRDNEKVSLPFIGVVKNGIYYIKVERNYGDVNGEKYTIKTKFISSDYYEKETNDSYQAATELMKNKEYKGTINSSDDKDYYRIVASSNGMIKLDFCHTYVDSYGIWMVSTYKYEDGEYIKLSSTNIDLRDNEKVSLPFIGTVKNGIYYIKVERSYGDVNGEEYTIKTKFTSSDYYEKESNDAYALATKMKLEKTYKGTINSSSDEDFYKIVSPESGIIAVSFNHQYVDKYGSWEIHGYRYVNGQYIELGNTSISLNDKRTSSAVGFYAVKNGTYYIKIIKNWGEVVGENYSLKGAFFANSPTKFSVSVKKNKATLTWSRAKNITGYEVYYKKGKTGKYKKLASTTKTKYTYKKLNKRNTYYFKVRAYKKVGGSKIYYSTYTNVKSARYK